VGRETVGRTGRPAYSLQIAGATHLSFMDVPFLPLAADSPARAMLAATSIDATHMRTVVGSLLVTFLAGEDMAGTLESEPVAAVTARLA